jgi:hypothetical protein
VRLAGSVSGGRLTEGCLVTQHAEADSRELVGQGTDGLVVVSAALDLSSPEANACQFDSFACGAGCRTEDRSGAVGRQHPQIFVAAFADTTKQTARPRGRLLGRQAEPGGEVASACEVSDSTAGGCGDGGGVSRPTPGTLMSPP